MTKETARPLGEWLRQRREELGISLEQAEAETRIRARYLEALEAEEFGALPDPIVGRGFLRNYAAYLDLDREEVAARSARFGTPPPEERLPGEAAPASGMDAFRPVPLHDMPGFRSRRGWIAGLAAVLVVALALAAWWNAPRIVAFWNWMLPKPRPTATQGATRTILPSATLTPSLAAVVSSTPIATAAEATPAKPTLQPTLTPTLTPSPSATPSRPVYLGIFLELVFTDTSWIQVSVDGVRQFQGELEDGTHRSWYGEERVELRIGNAGAVLVTVNGQSLGTLGAVGEVVDRVFEKVGEGVSEATVTAEASGTITVTATATPRPANTSPPPTEAPSATSAAEVTEAATSAPGVATPEPETPTPTVEITPSATLAPTEPPAATAGP